MYSSNVPSRIFFSNILISKTKDAPAIKNETSAIIQIRHIISTHMYEKMKLAIAKLVNTILTISYTINGFT